MNPSLIPHLLFKLAAVPSSGCVSNPYSVPARLGNLCAYLEALCAYPYSGHLFVGEAPGYRGCALTGIPFSSERILRSGSHPFLTGLLPSLSLAGNVSERTATIVWAKFAGKCGIPAFWNTFPFHPHSAGFCCDNRPPTALAIASGAPFLKTVVQILCPHTIVAVGRVAASVAPVLFPHLKHVAVPHPSFGGTAGFISGCDSLPMPCPGHPSLPKPCPGHPKSHKLSREEPMPAPKPVPAALKRNVTPDSVLAAVIGAAPVPFTMVTRRVWAYIKVNRLQHGREVKPGPDAKLKALFGGAEIVGFADVVKFAAQHIVHPV